MHPPAHTSLACVAPSLPPVSVRAPVAHAPRHAQYSQDSTNPQPRNCRSLNVLPDPTPHPAVLFSHTSYPCTPAPPSNCRNDAQPKRRLRANHPKPADALHHARRSHHHHLPQATPCPAASTRTAYRRQARWLSPSRFLLPQSTHEAAVPSPRCRRLRYHPQREPSPVVQACT